MGEFYRRFFSELRKASINFVMSVRLSVRPSATTRLPLNKMFTEYTFEHFFEKMSRKFKMLQPDRPQMTIQHGACAFHAA